MNTIQINSIFKNLNIRASRITHICFTFRFFILTCITRPVSMHSIAQEQPDITLLTLYESNMTTLTCVGGANTYNSALTFLTPFEPKYAEKTPSNMNISIHVLMCF